MAEVAGLVLGTVALVGTFKDCVDLYSYISAAKSLGRDRELLETKLDVEKTLLLQWADRIGLMKEGYDRRLDDPETLQAVTRVLTCVQLLLGESSRLQDHYRARPADTSDDRQQPAITGSLSDYRMQQFTRELEALPQRLKTQFHTSKRRRVRWVLWDKAKFESLLQELSYFNTKLNRLVPDAGGDVMTKTMNIQDVAGVADFNKLRLLPEAMRGHGETLVAIATEALCDTPEWRLLYRLRPHDLADRRDAVSKAHSKTFQWVLDSESSLCTWLRSGSGIYWLSGKAGSGKSTLMKFLQGHEGTARLLKEWAEDGPLLTPWFYFWHLGTHEQRTQEGLLRTLLYQILDDQPELIERALPGMYQQAKDLNPRYFQPHDISLPTQSELKEAFASFTTVGLLRGKMCFFIDGLDEFTGRYADAICFVRDLAQNPNIKVLVSSRPIPACVDAFYTGPMLQLQDLTYGDIEKYIDDTVGRHSYLIDTLGISEEEVERIKADLIEKAVGVFLWVVLACRSILEGFEAYDSLPDIQRRIDELPPELEDLFKHILTKIEPRYQAHAAKLLRLCYQNQLVADRDDGATLYTLGLALVDEVDMDLKRMQQVENLSTKQKHTKCRVFEGRLRSRCGGLIEVWRVKSYASKTCGCYHAHSHEDADELMQSEVSFMHRTVFEFLSTPGVWDLDCLCIDDSHRFNPSAVLAAVYLNLALARLACPAQFRYTVQGCVRHVLTHAANADALGSDLVFPVMLKLEVKLQDTSWMPSTMPLLLRMIDYERKATKPNFVILLAVEAGMVNFVQSYQTMKGLTHLPWGGGQPLLHHAACQPLLGRRESEAQGLAMISFLFSSSCDPNEVFVDDQGDYTTPWRAWLDVSYHHPPSLFSAAVMEAFITAGASLDGTDREGYSLEKRIRNQFINFGVGVPELLADRRVISAKGVELLRLLEETKARVDCGT